MQRRTTVAEYLVQRGLPADWRYGSPLGKVAARVYRETYHHEPSRAWRLINGRFRRVMAYRPAEAHVLAEAWELYPRTGAPQAPAPSRPRPVLSRIDQVLEDWHGSGDSMRWMPGEGSIGRHP
jgi:hypothetical protein